MQVAPVEGPPQAGEIAAAEDLRQGADGEEEGGSRGKPARPIPRERATRHDAVHVHMLRQGLAPGVEHGGHAELSAEVARITAEAGERGGRGVKEQPIEQARVALRQWVQLVRQGEDDMEVGNRQYLGPARGEPALGGQALAFGAVAITTGVVGDPFGAARRADGSMATEHGGAAGGDGAQGAALRAGQRIGTLIRRAVSADDIGELDPVCSRRAAAREGRRRRGHASGARRLGQIQGRAGGEHPAGRDVQIARGGGQVVMAEELLDGREIAAGLEQVGGEGVA